jgi:hypothetical protein
MAIPNGFKFELLKALLNTATLKVALLGAGHTINIDTQKFWSDVSANEIAGTGGYTTGGQALVNKTVTQDNTDDEGVLDADDPLWANSTISANYYVVYIDTGVAGTSLIVVNTSLGGLKTSTGGDFTIQFNVEGILNLN